METAKSEETAANGGASGPERLDHQLVVAALYKFAKLDDYKEMRGPLLKFCVENEIKGTLLVAEEGINGTVCGTREAIDKLLERLRGDERLKDLDHKESYHDDQPFLRMKVRLKKEIVTLGVEGIKPTEQAGTYVEPKEWNSLISDPDVILLDTRNKYEVDIGTFEGAVDPKTDSFREFPEFCEKYLKDQPKSKKIAMFCTGGIRCEKSTSLLKQQGYENVYHLKGGILKYLEQVPKEKSLWNGECYVFDHRIAVDHDLKRGSYDSCHGCRHPISDENKKHPNFRQGVHCEFCFDNVTPEHLERVLARQKQIELSKKRNDATPHIGVTHPKHRKIQLSGN